jgi:aspartate-semialdehyde dehydrogenase
LALFPLHEKFDLTDFCTSKYQAVSWVGYPRISALQHNIIGNFKLSQEVFGNKYSKMPYQKLGNFIPMAILQKN